MKIANYSLTRTMAYCKKDKNGITSKLSLFLLLMMNIFLFSLLVLHWYSSHQISDNFNDFSKQVKEELSNFSNLANNLANKVEGELQNIQKEIEGLTKTIEELNAIEGELKNITTGLAELNKTGEELKGTGENIKGSLDSLGELKEKIDELTKLEIPLIELEKSLIKGGEGLEKEIKEKIGGLIDKIDKLKKVVCPYCFNWNFRINLSSYSLSNRVVKEREWKKLFKSGKLIISGKVETVKYSRQGLLKFVTFNRTIINEVERDITIEEKEEIKGWKDKGEPKTGEEEERKEFIFKEACCKNCEKNLDLENFSIKKLIEE